MILFQSFKELRLIQINRWSSNQSQVLCSKLRLISILISPFTQRNVNKIVINTSSLKLKIKLSSGHVITL